MNTLYQYEDSFSDVYMSKVVTDLTKKAKSGKISKVCDVNSLQVNKLDNSGKNYNEALKQIFKNSFLSWLVKIFR